MLPDLSLPPRAADKDGGAAVVHNSSTFSERGADDGQSPWNIIQAWVQRILKVKLNSAQELADHIVKCNLMDGGDGSDGNDLKDFKKIKDKRKVGFIWNGKIPIGIINC